MWKDPVVEDVRKRRDEYARNLNYDLRAIYRDIKEQEAKADKRPVTLPARRTRPRKV